MNISYFLLILQKIRIFLADKTKWSNCTKMKRVLPKGKINFLYKSDKKVKKA